jgi:oligopeptide/dipeptide ABC transporter ATP-binding protein
VFAPRVDPEPALSQLLDIVDLSVAVSSGRREILLLDQVSIGIARGEVLGIVGESGSGKSMLALASLGLLPENIRVTAGSVNFDGLELTTMPRAMLNKVRGARISMIFQEPMTALNPMMRVGDQVAEVVRAHSLSKSDEVRDQVSRTLSEVGLPPRQIAVLYPHELSGGMRQRVMIAIATACSPDIIIADEPTTALDVTVQAQILTLLRSIVDRRGCALLLISHDIGVVSAMANRVAVMYAGSIVEDCPAKEFLKGAAHPYSKLLLETYVDADLEPIRRLPTIAGSMPMADERVNGCRFNPRCPQKLEVCQRSKPPIREANGHRVACYAVTPSSTPSRLLEESTNVE